MTAVERPGRACVSRLLPVWVLFTLACSEADRGPAPIPQPHPAFQPRPSRLAPGSAEGDCRLAPSEMSAAAVGTYILSCTVGPGGIGGGGGLLVDLPKAWFANPWPFRKIVQQEDPAAPHFLEVGCSRPGCGVSVELDSVGFDGDRERFRRSLSLAISGADLQAGDVVEVTLANTTAPYVAGADEVRVAVDPVGNGEFRLLRSGAAYRVLSAAAEEIRLTGPSQAVVGEPVELRITAFDRFFNLASELPLDLEVTGLGDSALGAEAVSPGTAEVTWIPASEGFQWPQATGVWSDNAAPPSRHRSISVAGGPVQVSSRRPARQLYWGDLHSHSRISPDGIGSGDFEYARDVAQLDFFASTEHSDDDGSWDRRTKGDAITAEEWEHVRSRVQELHEPGVFVTLLGYECSLRGGHHNVIFRSLDGVPWPAHRLGTASALWQKLKTGEAITIPHHLGLQPGRLATRTPGPGHQQITSARKFTHRGPKFDWTTPHDPVLRPALEIYSGHGTSESYDPSDPLSYENVRFAPSRSAEGPHYARDAWAKGHRMGVVAASDTHSARPGQHHTGLTAVLADELSREAIFDGLAARRSYGTTGQRIILDFRVGAAPIGSQVRISGSLTGSVLIAAPGDIRLAEVMALREGETAWRTIARWEDPGRLLKASFEEPPPDESVVYYLRAELQQTYGGRVARAWSSPIWVDAAG